MGFVTWTLGIPLALVLIGVALLLTPEPVNQFGGLVVGFGFVWLLFTGKARKTYWNTRVRAKAHQDARRAQLRSAKY